MNAQNLLAASLLTFGCLAALPIAAQEEPSTPAFGEIIEVRVVNLEVVVEDKKGNRVTGVPREDFRLLVDGRQVPIDYFTEIVEGRVESTGGERGLTPGSPLGTSYLVFVDELFGVEQDRNRILEGIADEVSRLGPADRMAVVAFDGKKIDLISNWSQSPADLQEALLDAKKRPSRGLMTRTVLRPRSGHLAFGSLEGLRRELEDRLKSVVLAATTTLRTFANPPGRKVMLLMSGGWPRSPVRYLLEGDFVFDYRRGDHILEPIYETANLLGYTLYPIDGPGIGHSGGADASRPGPAIRPNYAREDEVHQTLRVLAQATGGQPMLDSARIKAFDRVIEDTRTFYWLGFSPRWKGDNRGHALEVEVLRPGLKVRHRKGYEDMSRQKEVNFLVEGALLFGELPGSQPLEVEVGEPRKDGRKYLLPLKLSFPLDAVTVVPLRGRYVADLELRLASVDKEGHRSELDVIPIRLSGSKPPEPGQRGVQEVAARLRRQKHDLVVSLHDPLSGTILASVVHFEP